MGHRVLVTGGAGYIGSVVVEQLLARGHVPIVLDDLSTGHRAAIAQGVASISLRYFNAAGASERCGEDHEPETHLIPNVLRVAQGRAPALEVYGTDYPTPDGTAVRDYIHVLDLADAHIRALDAELDGAVAVNLGTGTGSSVLAIAEAARRVTGRAVATAARPRRPGDPPFLVAARGRAERLLGWRPRHSSLEEIIASAWAWHCAHPLGYGN